MAPGMVCKILLATQLICKLLILEQLQCSAVSGDRDIDGVDVRGLREPELGTSEPYLKVRVLLST